MTSLIELANIRQWVWPAFLIRRAKCLYLNKLGEFVLQFLALRDGGTGSDDCRVKT